MKTSFHRLLQCVLLAAALAAGVARPLRTASGAQTSAETLTTVYVNKYFEVREHEAPTKYVFKGNTRVARVAGSLTTNARQQRLRVYPGWNLCSLAVTASNTLSQLSQPSAQPGVEALYRWVPQGSNYAAVLPGETLPAGTVFWLKASTNVSLSVVGAYADPNSLRLAPGPNFIASAGLEEWTITNALPPTVSAWKYIAGTGGWGAWFAAPLQSRSDLAGFVAPGEALFIEAAAPVWLEVPDRTLRTIYYHQDHLGSSSATTDAAGNLVEEDTFYPFGHPRRTFQPKNVRESYTFTQKEQDQESGLDYFEARYLSVLEARFLSPDPLREAANPRNPQSWNCYAYTMNNPLRYVDPQGLYVWDASLGGIEKDKDVSKDTLDKRNAFRNALSAATAAADKVTDASDKDLATRAVRAYGAENEAGVTVGELSPARKGVVGGHTHIHWSGRGRKVASAGDVTLDFSVPSGSLTHTVAHEGSHAAAGQEYAAALQQSHKAAKANPDVNITDYEFERRGYTVESIIAQALNESVLAKGKRGEGMVIWDKSWKDFKTQRAAPIDQVVLKKYGTSPQNPGSRME